MVPPRPDLLIRSETVPVARPRLVTYKAGATAPAFGAAAEGREGKGEGRGNRESKGGAQKMDRNLPEPNK